MLLLYSLQEIHLFSRLELLMCSTPAFEPSSSPSESPGSPDPTRSVEPDPGTDVRVRV